MVDIFNFTGLDNNIIKKKEQNLWIFHRKLNLEIVHFHPKISFLINHLKKYKKYYDNYINLITYNKNNNNNDEEN